jgi:hypothetical protein
LNQFLNNKWAILASIFYATNDRERERVGRTSICCCCRGADDMEEVGKALAWTRWRWRWHGVEAGAEKGRACGVDPMAMEAAEESKSKRTM